MYRRQYRGSIYSRFRKCFHDIAWYNKPPVDLSEFGITEHDFPVACVANARPHKGLRYLLEAARLFNHISNIHILLVGMGIWFPLRQMGHQDEAFSLGSTVQMVETDLEGATPIVYIDEPSGWTVVWVVEAEEAG